MTAAEPAHTGSIRNGRDESQPGTVAVSQRNPPRLVLQLGEEAPAQSPVSLCPPCPWVRAGSLETLLSAQLRPTLGNCPGDRPSLLTGPQAPLAGVQDMRTRAHTQPCTHKTIRTHACAHMHIHTYTRNPCTRQAHACTHTYTGAHTMYTHARIHACTHTHIHRCTHSNHTEKHAHTRTHTATASHTLADTVGNRRLPGRESRPCHSLKAPVSPPVRAVTVVPATQAIASTALG